MSNINFRNFGNIIFGLISKYMEQYINPTILKEDFIKMFEEIVFKINNLQFKNGNNFYLDFQFILNLFLCNEFTILIPDEKSCFELYFQNLQGDINLIDLNYEEMENFLISNTKNLTDNFIEIVFNYITKKGDSPSMIEG